ncbi:putative actin-related protein 2/3 complex subunit 1A [Paraphysoderma sedebokerense]|nr:putative actin-related protein 2/3 complex subunit 1A [Paraphysoderma sedebokerense]
MSNPEIHQLVNAPITAHAFNKDRTKVAICPNNNEVQIYEKQGNAWVLGYVLEEHDKLVTSIDWAPNTNRIVSCSQDRNAYVWSWDAASSTWKPTLVLLRINRAATYVRWSPSETKFAVCSGARCISICYFEEDNDWWVSKHLKKPIRSTVLSLDWHTNDILVGVGSADCKARVLSAYIKGIDSKPPSNPWGDKLPFNTICGEFASETGGWVHGVAFSPNGDSLAWVAHDSSLNVYYPATQNLVVVKTNMLPFTSLLWLSGSSIIAVGHDCSPVLFTGGESGWTLRGKVDESSAKSSTASSNSAFDKFRQMDSKGTQNADTNISSVHQNTITCIRTYQGQPGSVQKYSTSGVDGKLVIWDVASLEKTFAGLRIR